MTMTTIYGWTSGNEIWCRCGGRVDGWGSSSTFSRGNFCVCVCFLSGVLVLGETSAKKKINK